MEYVHTGMLTLTILLSVSLQEVDRLVQDLSDERIDVRDLAERSLVKAGARAVAHLAPLLSCDDVEVQSRAESVVRSVGLTAVPLLERHGARDWANRLVRDKAWSHLKRDCCRVELREAPKWPATAELEAVTNGHLYGTVSAYRFHRGERGVKVLVVERDRELRIRHGTLDADVYGAWLRVLAAVHAARVTSEPEMEQRPSDRVRFATVRLRDSERVLMEQSYSGAFDGERVAQWGITDSAAGVVWSMVRDLPLTPMVPTPEDLEWIRRILDRAR